VLLIGISQGNGENVAVEQQNYSWFSTGYSILSYLIESNGWENTRTEDFFCFLNDKVGWVSFKVFQWFNLCLCCLFPTEQDGFHSLIYLNSAIETLRVRKRPRACLMSSIFNFLTANRNNNGSSLHFSQLHVSQFRFVWNNDNPSSLHVWMFAVKPSFDKSFCALL
jgi:hypothetical protein